MSYTGLEPIPSRRNERESYERGLAEGKERGTTEARKEALFLLNALVTQMGGEARVSRKQLEEQKLTINRRDDMETEEIVLWVEL